MMWRTYPECIFAHLYLYSRINPVSGDDIVDDTACGLIIDRRGNTFLDVQPTDDEKCEECFNWELEQIMKELAR